MKKALFLDLDHTLIRPKSGEGCFTILNDETASMPAGKSFLSREDIGNGYVKISYRNTFPKDADDWEFMPGMIANLLCEVDRHGSTNLDVIIVTNQGGVAAGHHTEGEIEQKLRQIRYQLSDAIHCPVYFYAAYKYDYNRKPLPGMAYQAALANRLSLFDSTMIGDMDSDKEFAQNAGIGKFIFTKDYLPSYAQ